MQINNYQSKPNFGMAFKLKSNGDIQDVSEKYFNYAIKNNAALRGHKQMCREQGDLKHVDIVFDATDNSVSLESGFTLHKKIPAYQEGETGYNSDSRNFPGKKLLTRIFNPKKLLPRNIYQAGEEAKQLDKKLHKNHSMLNEFKIHKN